MSSFIGLQCLVCENSIARLPGVEPVELKFRILFAVEGRWDEPHVVDVSNLDFDDDIHGYEIPLPDSQDTVAVHVSLGCHSGPCTSDPSTTCGFGYPIHDVCWEMLNACRSSRAQDLTALIRRHLSLPPNEVPHIGHCSGIPEIRDDGHGHPFHLLGWDPNSKIAYPPLKDVVLPPIASRISPTSRAPSDHDLLSMLPLEIVQEILTWLPSPDVKNFRLASRVAATTILSDFFWKSRYGGGLELAYLYDAPLSDPTMRGQWRSIYLRDRDLHTSQNDATRRFAVWGRCLNIWNVIDKLGSCQGTSGCGILDSSTEDYTTMQWTDASHAVQWDLQGGNDLRSRCLFERVATISSTTRQVCVSIFVFRDTCYISGLRFVDCDGSSTPIGYVRKGSEVCIPLPVVGPSEMPLTGFLLTLSRDGIHGIAVETKEESSSWVGECKEPGTHKDMFTRRLTWEVSGTPTGQWLVKGGFDDSRLVSLSTSVGTARTEVPRNYRPDEIQNHAMWRAKTSKTSPYLEYSMLEHYLEGPRCLRAWDDLTVSHPGNLPPQGLDFQIGSSLFQQDNGLKEFPLSWMSFDPAMVSEVDVYCSISHSRISGFRVGDNQIGHCMPGPARFQLKIDGPGGERITKITTVYRTLTAQEGRDLNHAREFPKKLCNIIIYTNRGQVLVAPPGPNIEKMSRYVHSTLEHDAITGFYAPVEHGFLDLGIAYQSAVQSLH